LSPTEKKREGASFPGWDSGPLCLEEGEDEERDGAEESGCWEGEPAPADADEGLGGVGDAGVVGAGVFLER